jgi:hypothetical protein
VNTAQRAQLIDRPGERVVPIHLDAEHAILNPAGRGLWWRRTSEDHDTQGWHGEQSFSTSLPLVNAPVQLPKIPLARTHVWVDA